MNSADVRGAYGGKAYVDDTDGNVGAMVTHTLKVGDEIRPNKSGFNGARAFLKSCDMVITEKSLKVVYGCFTPGVIAS